MPGIKLDAMETPYPWPPELAEAWQKQLLDLSVNRYPDPRGEEVKQALRNAMGVPPELDILLGNGSDEIIQMLAMAVAAPGREIGRASCRERVELGWDGGPEDAVRGV